MRKIMTLALAAFGLMMTASAVEPNIVYGNWILVEENGIPESGYVKAYTADGRFVVNRIQEQERTENSRKVVALRNVPVQKGSWELVNDSTLIEKCEWGDKGEVTIHFTTGENDLVETFAYSAAPDKQYTQKFAYMEELQLKDQPTSYYFRGLGSFGGVDNLVYQIEDQRYQTMDEFRKALPTDSSKIENMSVFKDSSADYCLTAEEKAAGKCGFIVVTLKK